MDNRMDRISRGLAGTSSRRQALKMLGGGLVGGALAGVGLTAANNAAAESGTVPNVGDWSLTDLTGTIDETGASVSGTLEPTEFFINRGELWMSGLFTPTDGVTEAQAFSAPVWQDSIWVGSQNAGSELTGIKAFQQSEGCDILTLRIGPIYLDLLGLVIEVPNEIVLTITAVPGGGNLLGNLLCAVAGLLDGQGGALGRLRNLLNDILAALGLA